MRLFATPADPDSRHVVKLLVLSGITSFPKKLNISVIPSKNSSIFGVLIAIPSSSNLQHIFKNNASHIITSPYVDEFLFIVNPISMFYLFCADSITDKETESQTLAPAF